MKLDSNYSSDISSLLNMQKKNSLFISTWDKDEDVLSFPNTKLNTYGKLEFNQAHQYFFSDEFTDLKKFIISENSEFFQYNISDLNFTFVSNGTIAAWLSLLTIFKEKKHIRVLLLSPTYYVYIEMLRQLNAEIYYDSVFDELQKHNIEPLVTISHYEPPIDLLLKYRGWYSRKTIELFERYVRTIVDRYKNKVKYWITFNEIDSMERHPYTTGGFLKEQFDDLDFHTVIAQAMHHQFVASALAVKICHEMIPGAQVGCMLTKLTYYPYSCKPEDALQAQQEMRRIYAFSDTQVFGEYPAYLLNHWKKDSIEVSMTTEDLLLMKQNPVDFVSFSYYTSSCCAKDPQGLPHAPGNTITAVKNPYLASNDWGWQIDALGLRISLVDLDDRYHKPLFIVENGIGANDLLIDGKVHDPYRIDYYREHINAMRDAIVEDSVDLIGYTCWSFIDLVSESTKQMSKRYGLVYVDCDDYGNGTYNRYKKDSFYWYKKVIATNGEDLS